MEGRQGAEMESEFVGSFKRRVEAGFPGVARSRRGLAASRGFGSLVVSGVFARIYPTRLRRLSSIHLLIRDPYCSSGTLLEAVGGGTACVKR